MLTLITGQPGHGKTAYALTRARALLAEGRKVYAHGVKDLDYDRIGFTYLEDPTKWQDLPDGSVVFIDECYTTFPSRNAGSRVPAHVEAMARHRHRGFDFLLVAQQGLQLDPFLRGLYEEHIHVRLKFGKATQLRRWSSYQGNVKAVCTDVMDWIRPNDIFQFYTSTTLNTRKLHIPKWIKVVAALTVALLLGVWYLKYSFTSKAQAAEAEAARMRGETGQAVGVTGVSGLPRAPGAPAAQPTYRTPGDYAKAHLPLFATMPWTAPVYHGQQPTTHPQVYCIASDAGRDADGKWREASQTCLTEQGTPYELSMGEARHIARYGMPYDAYRPQQAQPAPTPAPQVAGVGAAHVDRSSTAAIPTPGQIGAYGDIGIEAKPGPRSENPGWGMGG